MAELTVSFATRDDAEIPFHVRFVMCGNYVTCVAVKRDGKQEQYGEASPREMRAFAIALLTAIDAFWPSEEARGARDG